MKLVIPAIAVFLILSGCMFTRNIEENKFSHFEILIEQDGVVKEIVDNEVVLLRKPFAFVVKFSGPDSVYVNAGFNSCLFNELLEGKAPQKNTEINPSGIDEEFFNKDETLIVSNGLHNFWQYKNDEENRFDKVEKKGEIYFCRRTVSNLIILPDSKDENTDSIIKPKNRIPISEIKDNRLYIIAIKQEWNEDYTSKIEKMRVCFKIFFKEKNNEF